MIRVRRNLESVAPILRALEAEELTGWQLTVRLRFAAPDMLREGEGRIYPILYRLEDMGLISARWVELATRRRVYRLTEMGRHLLRRETI